MNEGELARNVKESGKCFPRSQGAAGFSEAKLLRLGFHDCLRYEDCTGGCDGCLNFEGMFSQHLGMKSEELAPETTDNNNLAYTADGLELIFQDPTFPPGAPTLKRSLKKSGKSRADLWAFATLVAIERAFAHSDQLCSEKTDIKSQFVFPREDVELQHSLLTAVGAKC